MVLTDNDIAIFERVEETVGRFFDIDVQRIFDKDTSNSASLARNVMYYILHYEYMFSSARIALRYGRDCRGVKKRIANMKFCIKNNNIYRKIYEDALEEVKNKEEE